MAKILWELQIKNTFEKKEKWNWSLVSKEIGGKLSIFVLEPKTSKFQTVGSAESSHRKKKYKVS